jgi:hypothetical protein
MSALPASTPGQGPRSAFFVRAHPLRALAEAWLLGGLLLAGLLSLHANLEPNVPGQGILFLSSGAALWCAVRGRLPCCRSRALRWAEEVVIAMLMSLSLILGWGIGGQRIWGNVLATANGSLDVTGFLLAASGAEFLAFRLAVYLWEFWAGLRRRHLLWALTHMQVQVMLVCALLYVALLIAALFAGGYLPSRQAESGGWVSLATSLVLTILPLLSVAVAGTLVILAVLLPPTILFAYLLSRRTTRRLEALAGQPAGCARVTMARAWRCRARTKWHNSRPTLTPWLAIWNEPWATCRPNVTGWQRCCKRGGNWWPVCPMNCARR